MKDTSIESISQMKYNKEELKKLLIFLTEVNDSFPISLNQKVDLDEYAKKILSLGTVIKMVQNEELIGIVTGYTNDNINHIGYISILAVSENHRGKKIGSKLLKAFLEKAQHSGMKKITLFTHNSNSNAIKMYLNQGFIIDDTIKKNYEFNLALSKYITV
ncbi:GNAT family N-acetyltransferase [Jeotgalibaca sp. A122]|uniref:GNAT family N-acetyltransferase n=1 Tax=Jeotgalibaca sp. A122 TaxID=3457322 RepID=UPI003FD10D93